MKKRITLENIPKTNPFTIPENYFETLQAKIESRIEAESEPIVLKLKPKWYKWSIAAAASLALLSGIYYNQTMNEIDKSENEIAQISDGQLIQYIEKQNIELADLTENTNMEVADLENILDLNINISDENLEKAVEEI